MVKLPIRTLEVAAVEPIGGQPFARVTIVTSLDGARRLANFMTDPEVPAHWIEISSTAEPEPTVLPDVDVPVDE